MSILYDITVIYNAAMKKVKHRLVEKMDESTADSLGLSRAVLVNGVCVLNNEITIITVYIMSRHFTLQINW